MKKAVLILLAVLLLAAGCTSEPRMAQQTIFAMDTAMTVTVCGDNCETLAANACAMINQLAAKWSVTDENSEIYRANNSESFPAEISDETVQLIEYALQIGEQTGGAFDITLYPVLCEWGFTTGEYKIPDEQRLQQLLEKTGSGRVAADGGRLTLTGGAQIDLGGIAKGYTGDILCAYLKENGVESALLSLGGNIHAVGAKSDGSAWRVGIKNPDGGENIAVLQLCDKAAVTSGGYERYFIGEDGVRYCHILDPKTGKPADSGLASVTIVGAQGWLCDALSTAVYVMGADAAAALWRERGDFDMVLLTDSSELLITAGLRGSIEPCADFAVRYID